MTDSLKQYYAKFPITSPTYTVVRKAGQQIREVASRNFSGRLIDIGCGEKRKQLLVGDFVDEYVGLDHLESLHDLSTLDIVGTAYHIAAKDEAFDCVLCTSVLEHLEEPEKAVREAYRVLKAGGVALYTAPLFWHIHEAPRDFFRYTEYGLRYLFEAAGFEVLEMIPLSGFWTTFGTEWNYYIQRFKRGRLSSVINGLVTLGNMVFPQLDRSFMLDRKFTWMYLTVVKKP